VKPIGFHPDADRELTDASLQYAAISAALGRSFVEQIGELLREVGSGPKRYRMFDPPMRRHFKRRFPYAILYVDQPDRVLIVAVMHCKQRPGYWRGRLG
jgi:plasmid stabilization system protein ParE